MNKINGNVEAYSVAKNGIKINGSWYNVKGNAQVMLKEIKMGSSVELSILEGTEKDVSFIKILGQSIPSKSVNPVSKDDYWANKEKREISYQQTIGNCASLNTALEILKMSNYVGKDAGSVLADGQNLAKEIKSWCEK